MHMNEPFLVPLYMEGDLVMLTPEHSVEVNTISPGCRSSVRGWLQVACVLCTTLYWHTFPAQVSYSWKL